MFLFKKISGKNCRFVAFRPELVMQEQFMWLYGNTLKCQIGVTSCKSDGMAKPALFKNDKF